MVVDAQRRRTLLDVVARTVKLKSMPSQRSFDDFLHSHHPAVAVLELARRSVTFFPYNFDWRFRMTCTSYPTKSGPHLPGTLLVILET
jgi:hypothetical protein